jgi:hypothetical protein
VTGKVRTMCKKHLDKAAKAKSARRSV